VYFFDIIFSVPALDVVACFRGATLVAGIATSAVDF
jgi:hypothetical protein